MLDIKNLSKQFDNFGFKLDDISIKLKPGYIMGFIGPNGAGKTTTIKLIMNLLKKDSGEINIFGKDHIKYEKEIKDRIGFVYEEPHFYEDLTLEQMKSIIAPFYSKWDDDVYYNYLSSFGLGNDMKIKKLSKGMKMKYSLAIALSHHADFIIMDEPTSGLDPVFRREMLDILYNIIQNENKSILFSTHITTDLEKIADYITYINNGKIVFSKSMDEVNDMYSIVKGGPEVLIEKSRKNILGIRKTKVGFEALTDNVEEILKDIKDEVIIERASLEDIMYYTRGGTND